MLNQDILDRLIYSKYLLCSGNDTFEKNSLLSDGFALLNFQDAAEMLLRTIASNLDANLKEMISFDEIINKIEQAPKNINNIRVPLKISLHKINKARVNFKHFGILPKHEDVIKIKSDVNAFFQQTLYSFFNLDLDRLSLKELIKHDRIKNIISKAEDNFEREDYLESIIESSKAFCLLINRIKLAKNRIDQNQKIDREVLKLIDKLGEIIDEHSLNFELYKNKIDLNEYDRFIQIKPCGVALSAAGTFCIDIFNNTKNIETKQNALFCINFVVNTAIKILDNNKLGTINSKRKFKITNKTNIIVYPVENKEVEIIRTANENEVLEGNYEYYDLKNHYAIFQDGSLAYIIKKDAELLISK